MVCGKESAVILTIVSLQVICYPLVALKLSLFFVFSSLIFFYNFFFLIEVYPGGTMVKNPPVNAGDLRNMGLIPVSGRSPGQGHGNPLQYSCLENPMDRGVRQTTKNQTRLSDWAHTLIYNEPISTVQHSDSCIHTYIYVCTIYTWIYTFFFNLFDYGLSWDIKYIKLVQK